MSLANHHGNAVSAAQEAVQELHQAKLEPPRELAAPAMRHWRYLTESKPQSSWGEVDLQNLCDLCELLVVFDDEKNQLRLEGHIITVNKKPVRNPRSGVVSHLRKEVLHMMNFFKIAPSDNAAPERQLTRKMKSTFDDVDEDDLLA